MKRCQAAESWSWKEVHTPSPDFLNKGTITQSDTNAFVCDEYGVKRNFIPSLISRSNSHCVCWCCFIKLKTSCLPLSHNTSMRDIEHSLSHFCVFILVIKAFVCNSKSSPYSRVTARWSLTASLLSSLKIGCDANHLWWIRCKQQTLRLTQMSTEVSKLAGQSLGAGSNKWVNPHRCTFTYWLLAASVYFGSISLCTVWTALFRKASLAGIYISVMSIKPSWLFFPFLSCCAIHCSRSASRCCYLIDSSHGNSDMMCHNTNMLAQSWKHFCNSVCSLMSWYIVTLSLRYKQWHRITE